MSMKAKLQMTVHILQHTLQYLTVRGAMFRVAHNSPVSPARWEAQDVQSVPLCKPSLSL
jgi:hypothetical protein